MVKKIIALGLAGLFSVGSCAIADDIDTISAMTKHKDDSKTPSTLLDRIFKLEGENRIGSLSELQKQVLLHPKSSNLYIQLGQAYFDDGDAPRAISNFQKALSVDPKCVQARIGISRTLFALGKYDLGFAELQKAYKEGDSYVSASALWESAFMHRELHQPQAALAQFNQVIKLGLAGKQRQATALLERAAIYTDLNRPAEALADYNESIKLDPYEILSRKDRAGLLIGMKRYREALADLNVAIEVMEGSVLSVWYVPCIKQRSVVYRALNQADLASKNDALIRSVQVRQFDYAPFRANKDMKKTLTTK